MGKKSRSAPYVPIIPPTYDPYAREKERECAKREAEMYRREMEYDRRREDNFQHSYDGLDMEADYRSVEADQWRRDRLVSNPEYGPDHSDWGKY